MIHRKIVLAALAIGSLMGVSSCAKNIQEKPKTRHPVIHPAVDKTDVLGIPYDTSEKEEVETQKRINELVDEEKAKEKEKKAEETKPARFYER